MFIHDLKGYIPMKKTPLTVLAKIARSSHIFNILISILKFTNLCFKFINPKEYCLFYIYLIKSYYFFSFTFGSFRRLSHCSSGAGLDQLNFCSFTLSLHVTIYSRISLFINCANIWMAKVCHLYLL